MSGKPFLDLGGTQHLVDLLVEKLDLPIGTIVMWSGTATSVPKNWAICNGQNGTPDLRGRFVLGAGNGYTAGATGGESKHTLTIDELPAHAHMVAGVNITDDAKGGSLFSGGEDTISPSDSAKTSSVGGGEPFEIMPPYYTMAYIMKVR